MSSNSPPSLSALAIRRHIATLIVTLTVIVLGSFFATRLQVDLLPAITYPRIGVQVNIPGIAPEVAVEEVTKPLEKALAATEGAIQSFSRTREGQVRVDLFFETGSNLDRALNDTVASFNRGRNRLPDNIEDARVFKFDPSQLPVYEFSLTSPSLSPTALRIFADEELGRELSVVNGVAAVDVSGGVKEEVQVNIDLNRLQATGLTLSDVLAVLRERNQDVSGGRMIGGSIEPLTRTVGRFQSASELENIGFLARRDSGDRRIYLRDFATVVDGTEEQRVFSALNGEPAVRVSISKQPDANTINVIDGIKEKLAELQKAGTIPEDAILTSTLDESKLIRNSINNVIVSGVVGSVLAAIAVLLFLGSLRQTFIIVLAIPLSTMMAAILMGVFGFSLNLFSLGGLALGVGIVVDNSIVMLENIVLGIQHWRAEGKNNYGQADPELDSLIDRTVRSSQEVESALIASTSTNLVAVLPFLLIGGFISLLFNELILTISFAVAASIIVAVTVVPALSSRLLAIPFSSRINRFWLLREFERRFEQATHGYQGVLARVLQHRVWAIAIAIAILGSGGLMMAQQLPQEILPQVQTGDVNLNAQFPPGTTLETNRRVMELVDKILLKQPETEFAFTTSGGSLFGNAVNQNPLRSSSTITLKPNSKLTAFIARVNAEIDKLNLAGIRIRVTPGRIRGVILNNSPIPRTDIDVILQSENVEALNRTGQELLETLEKEVKGATFRADVDARQPEVRILPNWERLQALGLSVLNVGETLQTAITGSVPTQLQRGDRLVDIRVRFDRQSIQRPSQLERLPLFARDGKPISLADVATVGSGLAPGEIQRIDRRQIYLLVGNLDRGASLSDALASTERAIADFKLPEGVKILPSTAQESNRQMQSALVTLGLLASFLVFAVMAVQYNSLIDPLVILLTIPLALAGGIFGLYITGTAISAVVIVGAVLLVGIVVNNAIVMVELANQIRERERCSRFQAIVTAAPQRLRPIAMTTITTVVGMFPLAMGWGEGGEFLQPLGIVVFSGLSLATLLTLLIVPCAYLLLHELRWDLVFQRLRQSVRVAWEKSRF